MVTPYILASIIWVLFSCSIANVLFSCSIGIVLQAGVGVYMIGIDELEVVDEDVEVEVDNE